MKLKPAIAILFIALVASTVSLFSQSNAPVANMPAVVVQNPHYTITTNETELIKRLAPGVNTDDRNYRIDPLSWIHPVRVTVFSNILADVVCNGSTNTVIVQSNIVASQSTNYWVYRKVYLGQ